MKPSAVEIVKSRLRVASEALRDLNTADTYDQFFDAWFVFLTAWKSIYTTLEQGAKPSPQSMQWFGGKARERKNDALLQYLFQARNDEEHGLKRSVEHGGGTQLYDVTPGQKISMLADPIYGKMRAVDVQTGQPLNLINEQPAGPTLAVVEDRNHKKYYPPIGFLGEILVDSSPIGVAEAALKYMELLVDEAEGLQ